MLCHLARFDEVHGENIASALDLREEPSGCKRLMRRRLLSSVFKAPFKVRVAREQLTWSGGLTVICPPCRLHRAYYALQVSIILLLLNPHLDC